MTIRLSMSDQCGRSRPGDPRSGFTLMELVVVVLILGIVSAVAVPKFAKQLDKYRAQAAARRIAADLNLARQTAKTMNTSRTVTFDVGNNRYDMSGFMDPDKPAVAYRVELAKTAYPARLVSVSFVEGTNAHRDIAFDVYCRPTTAGRTLASGTIVVSSGNQQRTVLLDPATGAASVP